LLGSHRVRDVLRQNQFALEPMHLSLIVPLPSALDEREGLVDGAKALIEPPRPALGGGNESEIVVVTLLEPRGLQLQRIASDPRDDAIETARHRLRPSKVNFASGALSDVTRLGR